MQTGTQDQLPARARAAEPIAAIAGLLAVCGGDVYLVGGTVRDLLLERPFLDVDLAVEGEPAELAAAIGGPAGVETRFGTISVERGGVRYDLARTRSERYPDPGALPEVEPAGIDADLRRRDFTVNALALGLSGSRAGELLSPPGGLDDLAHRRLAVLHDASFQDDPTRLLRLARYAARLGFTPAPHTRELAARAIADGALETVSGTRIGNELRLLAGERDPVAALESVHQLGLPWTIDADLARNAIGLLPADGRADLLALACVFGAQPGEPLAHELDRLGFTAAERDRIVEAAAAGRLARRLAAAHSRSEIARTVGASGVETVALAACQGAAVQSLTWLQDLRRLRLQISGTDLLARGIAEGPVIGTALQAARDALMDGEATDRESQLRVALRAAE